MCIRDRDDTIQHAGVVIGFGGIAGHTFIGLHKSENSYFNRAMCAQDYSAVTAACMMSKRSVFDAVGGFTEELAVAFNDIDYCMKDVYKRQVLCLSSWKIRRILKTPSLHRTHRT